VRGKGDAKIPGRNRNSKRGVFGEEIHLRARFREQELHLFLVPSRFNSERRDGRERTQKENLDRKPSIKKPKEPKNKKGERKWKRFGR